LWGGVPLKKKHNFVEGCEKAGGKKKGRQLSLAGSAFIKGKSVQSHIYVVRPTLNGQGGEGPKTAIQSVLPYREKDNGKMVKTGSGNVLKSHPWKHVLPPFWGTEGEGRLAGKGFESGIKMRGPSIKAKNDDRYSPFRRESHTRKIQNGTTIMIRGARFKEGQNKKSL